MDEQEKHFLEVLAGFNSQLAKIELEQEEILQNQKHGVFLTFEGIALNYNLPEYDQNKKEYQAEQKERNTAFLKVLQDHRMARKREFQRLKDTGYAALTSPRLGIEREMKILSLKIAFDEMYKESAGIGKYFFEARRDEKVVTDLKPVLESLIGLTGSIYQNARELELMDREWLQYFTEKQSVAKK